MVVIFHTYVIFRGSWQVLFPGRFVVRVRNNSYFVARLTAPREGPGEADTRPSRRKAETGWCGHPRSLIWGERAGGRGAGERGPEQRVLSGIPEVPRLEFGDESSRFRWSYSGPVTVARPR